MKKILIVNPFGIGDVLFSTTVVRAVKQAYPESYIGYLCNKNVAPVLEHNPAIDRLFFYSRGDLKQIRQRSFWGYVAAVFNAVRELRSQCFDCVFDLSMVTQYSFILWLIGVRRRYGFDYKGRGRFLTDALSVDSVKQRHVISYYRDLLVLSGINAFEQRLDLYVGEQARLWAENFLRQAGVNREVIIGIAPFGGASWGQDARQKQWPPERFAVVARALARRFSARIVVFGTPSDRGNGKKFIGNIGDAGVIDAVGRTDLEQCAALLEKCSLLLANDSGPLHMACALGIRTVAIFGPVDERVYGPIGDASRHRVITAAVDCRPCYVDFAKPYCQSVRCLREIKEETVIQAATELMEKDRSPMDEVRRSQKEANGEEKD